MAPEQLADGGAGANLAAMHEACHGTRLLGARRTEGAPRAGHLKDTDPKGQKAS